MGNGETNLPKYQCFKEVCALKIRKIILEERNNGTYLIVPDEEYYAPFEISKEYIEKHKPEVGGYYVVYKDGYKSYSPAVAFEEGYRLISPLGQ